MGDELPPSYNAHNNIVLKCTFVDVDHIGGFSWRFVLPLDAVRTWRVIYTIPEIFFWQKKTWADFLNFYWLLFFFEILIIVSLRQAIDLPESNTGSGSRTVPWRDYLLGTRHGC